MLRSLLCGTEPQMSCSVQGLTAQVSICGVLGACELNCPLRHTAADKQYGRDDHWIPTLQGTGQCRSIGSDHEDRRNP